MPHYNIWIREEDDKKWKSIENRSEWLHEQLRSVRSITKLDPAGVAAYEKMSGFKTTGDVTMVTSSDKEFELVEQLYEPVPKQLQPKFCKNGHPIPYPKSTCMGKGCKYS